MAEKKQAKVTVKPAESNGDNNDEQAKLELIRSVVNPTDDRIAEFTLIDRRAILHLSIQMTKELALDKKRIKARMPLSKVWRVSWLRLKRSQDKWFAMVTAGLAHEQMQTQAEKEEETGDKEWE